MTVATAGGWVIGIDAGASLTKCVVARAPSELAPSANANKQNAHACAASNEKERSAREQRAAPNTSASQTHARAGDTHAAHSPQLRERRIHWSAGNASRAAGLVRIFPRGETRALLAWLRAFAPARVGLTGGGAAALADALRAPCEHFDEFNAWAAGAGPLLARAGHAVAPPYLLVSMGTGTSAIRVTPDGAARAGGCALGGGTLLGLGRLLTGARAFREIAALAARGDRARGVDLDIADIYPALPRGFTAANFGGAGAVTGAPLRTEDLAHALAVLVGENVALVCCALARAERLTQLVFGGATLSKNPATWEIIERIAEVRGHKARYLEDGEYAGALGALLLTNARAGEEG